MKSEFPEDVVKLADEALSDGPEFMLPDYGVDREALTLAIARAIMADRASRPANLENAEIAEMGVKVKLLDWNGLEARSALGDLYQVVHLSENVCATYWNGTVFPGWNTAEEGAKAAAQAHADARIRSCLLDKPEAGEGGLDAYDAGLLGDGGGGNVGWWQDYMRAELARAHEFYADQFAALSRSDSGPDTDADALANKAADAVGVTPYSDMRPFVVQAVKYALTKEPTHE